MKRSVARLACVAALFAAASTSGPTDSAPVRCVEDDPCWLPALHGNGRGELDVFDTPFPALVP